MSVRRLPDLPPASSPPRIAATQLPLASGSAPCGPKRTFTSKFNAMRGTQWIPASAGKADQKECVIVRPLHTLAGASDDYIQTDPLPTSKAQTTIPAPVRAALRLKA